MGENNLKQPLTWNAKAQRLGIRHRVFCVLLPDVFACRSTDEAPAFMRVGGLFHGRNLAQAGPGTGGDWLAREGTP